MRPHRMFRIGVAVATTCESMSKAFPWWCDFNDRVTYKISSESPDIDFSTTQVHLFYFSQDSVSVNAYLGTHEFAHGV
jgi:hypothetical protein